MADLYDNILGAISDVQGKRFALFRILLFVSLIVIAIASILMDHNPADIYFFGLLVLIWFSLSLLTHVFLLNSNKLNTPVTVILGMVDAYLSASFLLSTGLPFALPLVFVIVYAFCCSLFCGIIPGTIAASSGAVTFMSVSVLDMGMSPWKLVVVPFAVLAAIMLGALCGKLSERSGRTGVTATKAGNQPVQGDWPAPAVQAPREHELALKLEAMKQSMGKLSQERDEALDRMAELEDKIAELEARLAERTSGNGGMEIR